MFTGAVSPFISVERQNSTGDLLLFLGVSSFYSLVLEVSEHTEGGI